MQWQFRNDLPIYTQLIAQFRQKIALGELRPGDRLPPVRDLALDIGVNPNTVQRAMAELERLGLVYCNRTAGRFVSENAAAIRQDREAVGRRLTGEYCVAMKGLGFRPEEILDFVTRAEKEEENHADPGMQGTE